MAGKMESGARASGPQGKKRAKTPSRRKRGASVAGEVAAPQGPEPARLQAQLRESIESATSVRSRAYANVRGKSQCTSCYWLTVIPGSTIR